MDNIRIGTCSWKYPSWERLVYSEAPENEYLRQYSAKYNTVEVDQWFWSLFDKGEPVLPKEEVVRDYAASVPEDFQFTIKVPNSVTLTHYYKKKGETDLRLNRHFLSVPLYRQFIDTLEPMNRKIGMLMFQFEYLNKQKMSSQAEFLERFGEFIEAIPRVYPIAIESRNPNFINNDYFDFLVKHKCAHVFLQGYYMPSILQFYASYKTKIRGNAVIRLHGTERGSIEKKTANKWNAIVEPKDEELTGIVQMIRELIKSHVGLFVNINNHYEGSAPLTIRKIEKMIQNSG